MHRNQRTGRVLLLWVLTGHDEESVVSSVFVAAVGVGSPGVKTVSHADRLCTLVAVFPTVLAGDTGQTTGGSHILERFMQKGVFWLTVTGIIVDTLHCLVALLRTYLYVLDFKPASPGEALWLSAKETHWLPQPLHQEERKAPWKS